MKRMYPIVLDVIKENRSNDPDVIARNLRIRVHYRSLPKHLKGLLIKTPFSRDIVINSKIDINHKKVALAHELGHVILHKGGYNLFDIDLFNDRDKREKEVKVKKWLIHACGIHLK